jgi:hypothetical protein
VAIGSRQPCDLWIAAFAAMTAGRDSFYLFASSYKSPLRRLVPRLHKHRRLRLAADQRGSQARVRRALAGDLPLTLEMIRNISAAWRIPADLLIGPAPVKAAAKRATR